MKKGLVFLFFVAAIAYGETQSKHAITIGYATTSLSTLDTRSLNASGTWLALRFQPEYSLTVSSITVVKSGQTGVLAAADFSCEIYSDVAAVPGTSLATCLPPNAVPVNGSTTTFHTCNYAVTAGNYYWAVLKNLNATQASNFMTYQTSQNGMSLRVGGQWNSFRTTDSGANWTQNVIGAGGWRIEYNDGSFGGTAVKQGTATGSIFDTTEIGIVFTVPSDWPTINVAGVLGALSKTGSPGVANVALYTGSSVVETSSTSVILSTSIATTLDYHSFYFPTVQALSAGETYRLTFREGTIGDGSGNRYNHYLITLVDTSTTTLNTMSFGGTLRSTSLSGGVWTDGTSTASAISVILDSNNPFDFSAGGTRANAFFK